MPKFSKKSKERLATCHIDLQMVMNEAIKTTDFTVLCGHRNKEDQTIAVNKGNSKTPWPKSMHNKVPSLAVDVVPYPVDWLDLESFKNLSAVILEAANSIGVKIRWGGNFKRLVDMPHYELIKT